jgi:cytidylate kinase
MIISIDGPAASGKSTTAKILADKLSLMYLDTGAMYRAVALYLHENNIDYTDFLLLESTLDVIKITFKTIDKKNHIFLNERDISEEIRTPTISKLASEIAKIKIIRKELVKQQRTIAEEQDLILEGRDAGTVVFPNADIKFFLTASLEARTLRRFKELSEKGYQVDYEEIKNDLIWRDQNDSTRLESPLKKAEDSIEINTTDMTIEQQVDSMLKHIKKLMEG